MFYIACKHGFVSGEASFDKDVRYARPFVTFAEADEYAKQYFRHGYYAILSTTIPEAA